MPYELALSPALKAQGWKVKIREKEANEPPHVSIMRRTTAWRWGLREEDQRFLDKEPDPNEVPREIVGVVAQNLVLLRNAWNRKYPENPI